VNDRKRQRDSKRKRGREKLRGRERKICTSICINQPLFPVDGHQPTTTRRREVLLTVFLVQNLTHRNTSTNPQFLLNTHPPLVTNNMSDNHF